MNNILVCVAVAAVIVLAFLLIRRRMAGRIGQSVDRRDPLGLLRLKSHFSGPQSEPSKPRVVAGFSVGDEVTFLEPNVGRIRGFIIRIKGLHPILARPIVSCTDGVTRRVRISRLNAV